MGAEDEDAGEYGDVTEDVRLEEPVVRQDLRTLAAKAMYRRASATYSMRRHSSGSRATSTVLGSTAARSEASMTDAIRGVEAALRVVPRGGDDSGTCTGTGTGTGLRADLEALLTLLLQEQELEAARVVPMEIEEKAEGTGTEARGEGGAGAGAGAGEGEGAGAGDVAILHSDVLDGMQVNGGKCAKRQGFWSQAVDTCTIYIPLCLLCGGNGSGSGSGSSSSSTKCKTRLVSAGGEGAGTVGKLEQVVPLPLHFRRDELEVTLDKAEVRVEYRGEVVLHSVLEYNIQPSLKKKSKTSGGAGASTWTLESPYTERHVASGGKVTVLKNKDGPASHLVLHVTKIPSLEWYPGCEWWDRIFVDDEAIDTTFCKVDAGSAADLPTRAVERAQQEHARFISQSPLEQQQELEGIAKMKNDFNAAVERHEAQQRRGLAEQEGRGEMLEAMSAEFPNIFFGTK